MPKIIKVNMCAECPFVDIKSAIEMRCLRAPSENYGTVIEDIFIIPEWCPLPDDSDRCDYGHIKTECRLDCRLECPYK